MSNATVNRVSINTKDFDTGGCFNNTSGTVTLNGLSVPAYSFCPNVAGYYQVNATLRWSANGATQAICWIFKNNIDFDRGNDLATVTSGVGSGGYLYSNLIYFNGTGDYINLNGYITAASGINFDYANYGACSKFSASLVRAA